MKGMFFSMQGLGDHIGANGLVRTLIEKHSLTSIDVLVWSIYADTVRFIYRDDPRINVINILRGREVISFMNVLQKNSYDIIYAIGHEISQDFLNTIKNTEVIYREFNELRSTFGEYNDVHRLFYKGAGVDFDARFDKFYYLRDVEAEETVYKKYNTHNLPYIFVHDDPARGYQVNVDWKFLIIRNNINENIFNYYKILQNAEEIHCMESSFRCLIETLDIVKPKLVFHYYIRQTKPLLDENNNFVEGVSRKPWNILV
jgi:hypothetical protein